MASSATDVKHLSKSQINSDVELEIVEDAADVGETRKRGLTLPGHSTVLMSFSGYCKAGISLLRLARCSACILLSLTIYKLVDTC